MTDASPGPAPLPDIHEVTDADVTTTGPTRSVADGVFFDPRLAGVPLVTALPNAPTRAENPKEKFGNRKPQLHLVPPILGITAASALHEGVIKGYGAYNWRKSAPLSMNTYIAGMIRHLEAFRDGEEIDPESITGKSHLAGLAASLAILLDARAIGNLVDDRPPPGPAARLLRDPAFVEPSK